MVGHRKDSELDEYLTLKEAAKQVPGTPHASTLWRWANKGVKGVRLEVFRFGARYFTTERALQAFAKRLAEASVCASDDRGEGTKEARPPLVIKPREQKDHRRAAIEAATKKLDAA